MKKYIVSTKTIKSKRGPKYNIVKEHVVYNDGTTEDRLFCYEFNGKPLGGIKDADRILAQREKARTPVSPAVLPKRKPKYEPK